MRGSIREDPTGGSVIRTYYFADLWLRVALVVSAIVLWTTVGPRFGTAELVYLALVVLILVGANQMYKSGNRELLLGAISRQGTTSADERR
ncbi:MAG TPA: hypothetical protein VK732_08410 [Verrucomicrobiae bacterium]|nr:hypothetical protein [Verrucomicrobiae bacterium]